MRRPMALATIALALLGAATPAARAQQRDEPDPCAQAVGRIENSACWTREAEHADQEMRQVYDKLLLALPRPTAEALRKAQKAWQESRDAHLALLFLMANPSNVHRWEASICAAIARRELAVGRARALRRLAEPREDDACPLLEQARERRDDPPRSAQASVQGRSLLLTNASIRPSGDQEGTLIVPCPPYR